MRSFICTFALVFSGSLCLAGCESTNLPPHTSAKPLLPANATPTNLSGFSSEEITRAKNLYNAKCALCHKFYDPAAYNDAEWRTWMTKMSKKAHLKTEQSDLLSRYLEGFRNSPSKPDTANPTKP